MSIRSREERARGGDFFGFVSSVLSDVTRKLEGGFSGEEDRRNTIELLERSRLNTTRLQDQLTEDQYTTLSVALDELIVVLTTREDEWDVQNLDNQTTAGGYKIQEGRGPPRFNFDPDQLKELLRRGFTVSAIAREGLLGTVVHRNTITKFMQRHGIVLPKVEFSTSDECLEQVIREYVEGHPNAGYEEVRAFLKTRQPPIFVTRARVRQLVAEIDPQGVASRWSAVAQRRSYSVQSPNSLWHIDGHHSLVRYGMYVHGGIDGFSRLIPYLRCSPFNTAKVAFGSFLVGVEKYSVPSRVRLDAGVENGLIRNFMVHANGPDRGSALTGKSVHNQRIERLWRDVYSKVLQVFYQTFHALEDSRALDPGNQLHIYCLQHVFLPLINDELERWRVIHNSQGVRTEGHRTPEQLWLSGVLSQRGSSGTAIQNVMAEHDIATMAESVCPGLDVASVTDLSALNCPRPCGVVTDDIRRQLLSSVSYSPSLQAGLSKYAEVLQFVLSMVNPQ